MIQCMMHGRYGNSNNSSRMAPNHASNHVDLAFGDGHALWPVVDHSPAYKVMLDRPPRPTDGRGGVVVETDRDRGRVETPCPARRARTFHLEQMRCAGS